MRASENDLRALENDLRASENDLRALAKVSRYPYVEACLIDWDSLMDCQGGQGQMEGQEDQEEVKEPGHLVI